MRILRTGLLLVGASAALTTAQADVKLAALFGDHLVLQRNARVHLWGSAAPGELILVRPSWYERDAAVSAGPDGRFLVALATPQAGGPHTIRLEGQNTVLLSDVLIGEVWLASGQSNMEMGVGCPGPGYTGVENWEQELKDADRPRIRCFTVDNQLASLPLEDVRGRWRVADAVNVPSFSAVAWFFAKRLERELDVPIGVVCADWGGTPAQAWMSASSLAGFERFSEELAACAEIEPDPASRARQRAEAAELFAQKVAAVDSLSANRAQMPRFDDSAWELSEQPATWSGELADFDGAVWLRRSVELPADWQAQALELGLGPIDDDDTTWWNGTQVGATRGAGNLRTYRIAPELVVGTRALIAVRVIDTGGDGGLRGDPAQLYIGRRDTREKISLSGTWRRARGASLAQLPANPGDYEPNSHSPSVLFNGMIAPLLKNTFAGVLWYQGESNIAFAQEYEPLFQALIGDWRAKFQRELPFYFVQIAPFGYRGDTVNTAQLRASQAAALSLPHTGMVVTLDIGDPLDIHPKKKQEVGWRLASFALRDLYGRKEEICEAPRLSKASADAGVVQLEFVGVEPVEDCGPSAFELAGEDGKFVAALQTVRGRAVELVAEGIAVPAQLRYAWSAAPTASLRGAQSGLPVAPFLVDLRR
jgi:sialate O-acetylesterase